MKNFVLYLRNSSEVLDEFILPESPESVRLCLQSVEHLQVVLQVCLRCDGKESDRSLVRCGFINYHSAEEVVQAADALISLGIDIQRISVDRDSSCSATIVFS